MSRTIGMELHEEIVTELQYKLEELERDVDDLNEEIADNEQAYKEAIVDLEKKMLEALEDKKCKEYDEADESYNYGIEVCICYAEDLFKDLLNKLGGYKDA